MTNVPDDDSWAVTACADAELGDARRTQRLVELATVLAQRPIAEKESQKWLTSVEAVIEAQAQCPQTSFVCIGDREADVYDLFLQARPAGVDVLVRASWNRRVDHPERYLWATVTAQPVVATLTVRVPRHGPQSARKPP